MNDFNFQSNFNFEMESKTDLHFTDRGKKSRNAINFTNILECNEAMKFEVVKSINFKIPLLGENIFIITAKEFSLLDVVNFIEKQTGLISDIVIFFFTVNERAAQYTAELSKRTNLRVLISDIMNSKRDKEKMITKIFDESNVEIVFCHSHAKVVSFKIDENYFTLVGSMNAGTNAKIENLNIINSKEMYNFVLKTFDELKSKFSIKKRYGVDK